MMTFDPQDWILIPLFAILCYTVSRLLGDPIQPIGKANEERPHTHKRPAVRNRPPRILGSRRSFPRLTRSTSTPQPSQKESHHA